MSAKRKSAIRVANAILCDDIRQEISNKLILIGVYTHDILVPAFPTTINLALVAETWFDSVGEKKLSVRYLVDGSERGGMTATLRIMEPAEPFILTLPPIPVQIFQPGKLDVQATVDDGRPVPIISRQLRLQSEGNPPNS